MELGLLLFIFFTGWFLLSYLPNEFELENEKKGDRHLLIMLLWIVGGTAFILIFALS
tara:strand:- start:339 stop:509 length:171 start_codon:yes stop_codon:yes gene_type:complete